MAEGGTDLDSNVETDECLSNADVCRPFQTSQHHSKVCVVVSEECGEHLNEQATLNEIGNCQDKKLYHQKLTTNVLAVKNERGGHLHEQFSLAALEGCTDKELHDQKEDGQETEAILQRLGDISLHEQTIEHGTDPLNAERTGDIEKHIIEDFTYTCIDAEGDTPLHLAIIFLYTIERIYCIINTILKRFPDHDVLNHQNHQYRQTPLHLAVLTRRTDIVRFLLALGAQTTLQDNQLRTPAHIACVKGDGESLNALLEAEDNEPTRSVSFYDNQGQTCLHIAVLNGNCEQVHTLLYHGADINAPDRRSGRTALHFAAEAGDSPMVALLLGNEGLKLDAPTWSGYTALQLAIGRPKPNSAVVARLRSFGPADEDLVVKVADNKDFEK